MENRALQARLVAALIARGYGEFVWDHRNFIKLKAIGTNPVEFYYVGKAGGLAKGACYNESHSVPHTFKKGLLQP